MMPLPAVSLSAPILWMERAIHDLACGIPVILTDPVGGCVFVMPLERFSHVWTPWLLAHQAQIWYGYQPKGHRDSAPLYGCSFTGEVRQILDHLTAGIVPLAGSVAVEHALAVPLRDMLYSVEIMPASVVAFITATEGDELKARFGLTCLPYTVFENIAQTEDSSVERITTAQLPLAGSDINTLCVFRGHPDGKDHYALVVGGEAALRHNPLPLVRVHAECFTGDLLGSLKCDCGSQLQNAITLMTRAGGGILVYMRQEGRGIGLTNKLRAYALQDQGHDTVDANLKLGFAMDQRNFKTASDILKALGVMKINLLTNNPLKVESLSHYGIQIMERTPLVVGGNPHNQAYLQVKQIRAGHWGAGE